MAETVVVPPAYRAAYERLQADPQAAWLRSLRQAAFQHFTRDGFPRPSQEDWKYTNVDAIASTPFKVASLAVPNLRADALAPHAYPGLSGPSLVFVNGRYSAPLSRRAGLPAGVRFQSLAEALNERPQELEPMLGQHAPIEHRPFVALNTALFVDGAFIDVPHGTILTEPLHVIHLVAPGGQPVAAFPRNLVRLATNTELTLLETYVGHGDGVGFTNAVTEVQADAGAILHHVKIQREPETNFHVHTHAIEQAGRSVVDHHHISFGARLARTDVVQTFEGEGAELTLNGLYVLRGEQHLDNHTFIDHARPRCQSREFFKGVLDGNSRGVFYGKVLVRKDAQKTNASQTNKNLLLSDGALVDSIPALEIHADDVKCSHGSTIGQLDKDSVFYLRARGLDEATARSLLTFAFARDLVGLIPIPAVRAAAEGWLVERLPNGRAVQEAIRDAN